MAEILLSGVLRKLAGLTVEKVFQLCGINEAIAKLDSLKEIMEEIEKLQKELSWIQDFIEDADKRCIVDKTHKRWLADLIEIAYQIEDALDIFFLKCPTALEGQSLPKKILGFGKKILKLKFLYEFQEEMIKIRKEISRIDECRKTYEIKNLGEDISSTQSDLGHKHKLDPIGDPEVVGFDEDIKEVVKNLCDVNHRMLEVVSIVGPGGIGKTTLARKVCHSKKVMSKFGKSALVTISQMYDLFHVLKKIAKSFNLVPDNLDANELANKIREHLARRTYLIVLDDIWTKKLCDELLRNGVLPDNKFSGSRVLITTRNIEVARYARKTYEPYELRFLNCDESLELFLKNAIPENHQCSERLSPNLYGLAEQFTKKIRLFLKIAIPENNQCFENLGPNLYELAKEFVKKCKGLPLALIVLGRLLSTKDRDYHKWKELLETMSWQDEDLDECSKIMATSFDHLPFARKLCFMYFAAFPEDYEIGCESLLRMWVAEGFIPPVERKALEQTAMDFLEDLVHRSMVQVASRNEVDGSIEFLRVHDILRDLAVEKAKENNFLVVCSKQADWNLEHCRKARRFAVHYSNFNEHIQQFASSNLRSLLIFGRESNLDCFKFRLLRVLAQVNSPDIREVLKLQSFTRLSHLRYLQFRPLEYYEENIQNDFWKWLEAMKSLETLDCGGVSRARGDQTQQMWKIETLRHVSLDYKIKQCVDGPPASTNLPNLQTLKYVTASPTWSTLQLPNISELRELSIRVERDYPLDVIAALLGKLNHLVFLLMWSDGIQIQQMFEGVFRFLEKLKDMRISNVVFENSLPALELKDNMLPPNLINLFLNGFEFKSDPMPVLEKLSNLKILKITTSNREYPLKIKCSAGGFKQLEELTLENILMLQGWEVELGALPLLKRLQVILCSQLRVPQPKWFIDHKSLRHLGWMEDSEITDLEEADKSKLSEIFDARPDLRRE